MTARYGFIGPLRYSDQPARLFALAAPQPQMGQPAGIWRLRCAYPSSINAWPERELPPNGRIFEAGKRGVGTLRGGKGRKSKAESEATRTHGPRRELAAK